MKARIDQLKKEEALSRQDQKLKIQAKIDRMSTNLRDLHNGSNGY